MNSTNQDHNPILAEIISNHPTVSKENFKRAESGTIHEVYLSENFVIRIRHNDTSILERENQLLKTLNNPLIPQILFTGSVN